MPRIRRTTDTGGSSLHTGHKAELDTLLTTELRRHVEQWRWKWPDAEATARESLHMPKIVRLSNRPSPGGGFFHRGGEPK